MAKGADKRSLALSYMPVIDGLRGLAALLVMWYHAPFIFGGVDHVAPPTKLFWRAGMAGWCGVDLFFVISGFLITTVLLKTKARGGRTRTFLARRALRIFPLLFVYLGLLAGMLALGDPLRAMPGIDGLGAYFLFVGNFRIAVGGWQPLVVMILWSIALEEQFYLLWPWVLRWLSRRTMLLVCAALLIVSPLLRWALPFYPAVYVLPFCRADTLAMGAGLALAMADPENRDVIVRWCRRLSVPAVGLIVVAFALPLSISFEAMRPLWFTTLGYTALGLSFTAITGAVSGSENRVVLRVLANPVLRYVGKLCFGFYIWHCLVGLTVQRFVGTAVSMEVRALIWVAATAAVASISWYVLESPFLALKRFFPTHTQNEAKAAVSAVASAELSPDP